MDQVEREGLGDNGLGQGAHHNKHEAPDAREPSPDLGPSHHNKHEAPESD